MTDKISQFPIIWDHKWIDQIYTPIDKKDLDTWKIALFAGKDFSSIEVSDFLQKNRNFVHSILSETSQNISKNYQIIYTLDWASENKLKHIWEIYVKHIEKTFQYIQENEIFPQQEEIGEIWFRVKFLLAKYMYKKLQTEIISLSKDYNISDVLLKKNHDFSTPYSFFRQESYRKILNYNIVEEIIKRGIDDVELPEIIQGLSEIIGLIVHDIHIALDAILDTFEYLEIYEDYEIDMEDREFQEIIWELLDHYSFILTQKLENFINKL